jgi:hypothetical protein
VKQKPLIEKYITFLRISEEQTRARIRDEVGHLPSHEDLNMQLLTAYTTVYRHMTESSQKYRLTRSGMAMVAALRPQPLLRGESSMSVLMEIADHKRPLDPDIETPIAQLPGAPIWIELVEPINVNTGDIAAIFFTCADREVDYQLSLPQPRGLRKMLEQSVRKPGDEFRWSLHFIDSNGIPRSHYEYYERAQRWGIIPHGEEPCPTDECVTEEWEDAEGFTQYKVNPCPFCATILGYWRSWFVTALLAVSGEFAETEEVEWPVQTEEVVRKVLRPHSAKFDQITVKHDYYIVSFDASVKKHLKPQDPGEPRGSWIEAAREIDPDSVVYVRHNFGQTERVLDPARNPRWKAKKTVTVRPHERRVPMKIDTLQHKITLVVASKYQQ